MKLKIKYFSTLCIVALLFLFTGCLFNLSVPVVTFKDGIISWQSQSDVESYTIVFDENTYSTTDTSFDLTPYITGNGQKVKVKAKSSSFFMGDSDFSKELNIEISETALTIPTNIVTPIEANEYTVSWNNVIHATKYIVGLKSVNGQEKFYTTETNSLKLKQYLSSGGTYYIRVRAVCDDFSLYAPSTYSDNIEFDCPFPLNTPEISGISKNGNDYILTWKRVDNAVKYLVCDINGQTLETTDTNANVASLLTDNANFLFVQAISDGTAQDSAFSNGISYFKTVNETVLANQTLNYVGNSFDLVANNAKELESIIYFTLLYRIENIKFYIDNNYISGATAKNNAVYSYLDAYNEIKSLVPEYSCYGGSLMTLNITYYHVASPTLTSEEEWSVEQEATIQPQNYASASNKRSSEFTYSDLSINDRTKTALVFTSDQLYYALQYGCKPIFASNTCPAKLVYKEALSVLKEIISDGMTEYEKTLALYEWLVYNTRYDHNLLALSNELEGSSNKTIRQTAQATLSKYQGFYIEGVLSDNGKAVCDGIAKTFVLLCNMENITCCKVSGLAGEGVNTDKSKGGSHAWNKVNIQVPGETEKYWYTVDATWADLSFKDSQNKTYTEVLSHDYFLVGDDDIITNHYIEDTIGGATDAEHKFNYYTATTVGTSDLLIADSSELETLLKYAVDNHLNYIEFKIASNYSYQDCESKIQGLFRFTGYCGMRVSSYDAYDNDKTYIIGMSYSSYD